jgi:hypothetical protein
MDIFLSGKPDKGEVCIGVITEELFDVAEWVTKRIEKEPYTGTLIRANPDPEDDEPHPKIGLTLSKKPQFLMYVKAEEFYRVAKKPMPQEIQTTE